MSNLMDLDGIGRVRPGRARRRARRGSRARRRELRAARHASGYELVFVGLGTATSLAAAASVTYTVRAQKDQIPVAFFADQTADDCTIEAWTISGQNVLRGAGGASIRSFHPKNTQRPAFAWPKWSGGSDMVVTIKNNHGATARVVSGGVLVLRKKEGV